MQAWTEILKDELLANRELVVADEQLHWVAAMQQRKRHR
jgi:hypothetical protein